MIMLLHVELNMILEVSIYRQFGARRALSLCKMMDRRIVNPDRQSRLVHIRRCNVIYDV